MEDELSAVHTLIVLLYAKNLDIKVKEVVNYYYFI